MLYVHVFGVSGGACAGCAWCRTGADRVGIPGGYSPAHPPRYPASVLRGAAQKHPAKRAPEGPEGLEWGGAGSGDYRVGGRRRGRPWYHPAGPVGLPEPSLYQDLRMPPYSQRGEN